MIDLRSDTVTQPSAAMRQAIAAAPVGDDVHGEDPTVQRLQKRMAALLGKEAALFVTSGTQANLCALMSHCQRGDEALLGDQAHCYQDEAGGAAVLGSIHSQPLRQRADGTIALEEIAAAIKPDDPHHARTRLLALENTWRGQVLPLGYLQQASMLARRQALATHLDGARLFNAAVAQARRNGRSAMEQAREIAAPFDSISVCFSKGLGAPAGSVVVGSRDFIGRALRVRKMLGGALRQSGILAAAALHALEHHVERLHEDHTHARLLAEGLQDLAGVQVDAPQTNMVWLRLAPEKTAGAVQRLADAGVLCSGGQSLRLVTHLDLDRADIEQAIGVLRDRL